MPSYVGGALAVTLAFLAQPLLRDGKETSSVQPCDPAAQVANIQQRVIDGKKFKAQVLMSRNKSAYLKVFEADASGEKTKLTIDPVVLKACGAKAVRYVGVRDSSHTIWDRFGDMTPVEPGLDLSQTASKDALIQQLGWDGGLSTGNSYDDSSKAVVETRTIQFSRNAHVGFDTDFMGTQGAGFIDVESHKTVGLMP